MNKEEIREQIRALAKQYARCLEEEKAARGKDSYVRVSGKDVGEAELLNMIDASLDMWLTAGRFNDEFEREFAKKLGKQRADALKSANEGLKNYF